MVITLLVFLHLLATCAAIGTIVITDMRLVAKLIGYRVVIPRPERFETIMITVSLVGLYLSGAALVALRVLESPDYLGSGKLQAKLVLVGLLTLNALVLHRKVFPLLALSRPLSHWSGRQWLMVSASVSLSNSLWLYSAFLGVARNWNHAVGFAFVLGIAAAVWSVVFLLVNMALALGSRDAPKSQPDWVDATISTLGGITRVAARPRPGEGGMGGGSANQRHYGRHVADRRADGSADRRARNG